MRGSMKKTIAALVILLAFLAWSAWPFFALFDLARAVQAGDVAKVERRVDVARLRASFSDQLIAAYERVTGKRIDRGLLGVAAGTVADPFIEKLLTPQNVTELLRRGWPAAVLAEPPPPDTVAPRIGSLSDILRLYVAADYGIGAFRLALPLDAPAEKRFLLRLSLSRWTWKIDGLDLPPALADRIARELIKARLTG